MKTFSVKRLVFVVVLSALAAAVYAGGQSGSAAAGTGKKGLLANGDVAFSVFSGVGYSSKNTSYTYADNTFTRKISDATGIKLNMESVSMADVKTRVSTMLNTGDYPEIFFLTDFTQDELSYYGSQGLFIPLDSYDLTKYPRINKMLTEHPEVRPAKSAADGKLYALPGYNDCIHCVYDVGTFNYYMPWLRDNGIKKPTTYDEFISYLRYVKANDMNGNGDKTDEIPLLWTPGDLWNAIGVFARNWMPYLYGNMANINGRVTLQYTLPEFRSTLSQMNALYKEGLIAEDVFTMSGDDRSYLVNAETIVVAASIGRNVSSDRSTLEGAKRWVNYMVLPPLKGVHGQSYAGYALYDGSTSMVITDKCKNPELAIALYDYLLDPYIVISSDYGEQGVGWDMPDAGQLSYLGTTPVFKLISNAQIPLNTTWNYGNMYGYLKDVRYGEQANDFATVQKFYDTWDASLVDRVANNPSYYTEYYVVGFAPHEGKYPPISMYVLNSAKSDADSNRINDINATLNTYRDQTVTEFIMGTRNISSDAEWNAYLTQLNQLGAAELVSIYQKYIK